MSKRKTEIKWVLIVFFLSALFLSVFSYYTSPFCKTNGYDSSFFILVGQGMTKGLQPYRNFFDMKGPYLFLIEYLGQLIFYGRVGCFLMQLIALFLSPILIDRVHRHSKPDLTLANHTLLLLPYLAFMVVTFAGGGYTEKFSQPFILLCVYFAVKFLDSEAEEHPPLYAAVYGACFMVLALIRITNTVTICSLVFVIMLCLIIKKSS